MALELDRLHKHFYRANTKHSTSQADKFVDEMRLYLWQGIQLTIAEEANHYESLVLVLSEHM